MIEKCEVYKNGERVYWEEVCRSNAVKDPVTLKIDISEKMLEDIILWARKNNTTLFNELSLLISNKWKRIKRNTPKSNDN